MANSKFARRKIYLIDKTHQIRFMLLIVCYLIIYGGLFAFTIFFPSIKIILSGTASLASRFAASKELLFLDTVFWPAIALLVVVIGVHSIIITHKIFGPLYKIKKTLHNMAAGNFTSNTKLRKHDYLKDFAEELNNCNLLIKNKLKNLHTGQKEILDLLNELEKQISEKNIPYEDLTKTINILKVKHNDNNLLNFFKILD
ncbi:MAG: hypothetical protein V1872_09895 [bacterium]